MEDDRTHLVFALFEIIHDLCIICEHVKTIVEAVQTFCELGKISAIDVVVGLQEDLSETRLADRVIL